MNVDVSELMKKKVFKKDINLEFTEKDFKDKGEDIKFAKPVEFQGTLSLVGDILDLKGAFTTELILICSRCLEEFKYQIKLEVNEKFTTNEESSDDDTTLIQHDNIDLTDIVRNNISMSLPIKKLCKEDCKGLCQHCGANLNFSTCKCENEDIDPRLAKLKDLFSAN